MEMNYLGVTLDNFVTSQGEIELALRKKACEIETS